MDFFSPLPALQGHDTWGNQLLGTHLPLGSFILVSSCLRLAAAAAAAAAGHTYLITAPCFADTDCGTVLNPYAILNCCPSQVDFSQAN